MRFLWVLLLLMAALQVRAQKFEPVSGPVVDGPMLRYVDIKAGDGAVAGPGKQYTVNYTGWLRDGTQFDSSIGKQPLQFVQGRRQVIPGFEVGFDGMKVGGKRRIFIPYQFAYGEQGRGKIPPKAELIFDVELLAVKEPSLQAPAGDLLLPLTELQDHVLALAKAVPESKYDWRPAPGVRSFREVFLHIAYGIHLMLTMSQGASADDVKNQIAVQMKKEVEPTSKDDIVKLLGERFAEARTAIVDARAGSLTRDIDFFGTQTTQRAVLDLVTTHIAEHMGQAIAYARSNGIVPPWSAK